MNIAKALVTAAAPDQHTLPLQRLVDQQGVERTALQLIIAEVAAAGVDEIGVVIRPGDEAAYRAAAGEDVQRLTFLPQAEPRGYGHAVFCGRDFVGDEPFLHLVGDHLYLSRTERPCAAQLIDAAKAHGCAVSAVQATRENKLPYFGAIGGRAVPQQTGLYEVTTVVEKPTPTVAEQQLIIGGQRAGYYLCFFGMHVLTPAVMAALGELLEAESERRAQLSDALAVLAARERYLALEVDGARYNIGEKYGILTAQLATALSGVDRDQILTELVELLAGAAGDRA
ncbi:MAG: UTP--glucose-1-phosphate uridylyltransferase [Planctomycetaceae bacterium]|nr:UTP--glucose-1-phosphate uridylyltransferase [Planctomycetaceae bacterium]